MGHVALGTLPLFTMRDSNFLEMVRGSLELCNIGPLQVRTKTRAQHAAGASSGSRSSSSLKCVVVSTLQYTMLHNPPQVQDTPPLSSLSLSPDPQDSFTPAPLHLAVDSQTKNHSPVPPKAEINIYSPVNNPYVDLPVCPLVVVNKA
jgi:hypothetical protein